MSGFGGKGAPSSSAAPSVDTGVTSGLNPMANAPSSRAKSVYSPSETSTWLTCPVLRQFEKEWEPREVEWDPARLLGISVQAGASEWLRAVKLGVEPNESKVEEAVLTALRGGYQPQPKWTLEGLGKLALRGLNALLDVDLFNRHHVLMVDEPLSASRPDVVSRHETDGLGVTDFKVSRVVDERYRSQRLSSYETDDQFWHYVWEVGESLGEPVQWFRPVVVILTPRATVLTDTVHVTSERLQFWLQGAEQHWRDMGAEDRGERVVAPNWQACRGGRFGVCKAYDFCHLLSRDPQRATVYYERRVRG